MSPVLNDGFFRGVPQKMSPALPDRPSLRQWAYRLYNGVRKVAAGLRPFSESVWPGVRNDLFVAHASIYEFAARYTTGLRTLDAGCGTGYGSYFLATRGAAEVTGIDIDNSNLRFARRRYEATNRRFCHGDLENLAFPRSSFDVVVASNSIEHLLEPGRFLDGLKTILNHDAGIAILAVPPIYSQSDVDLHGTIHYHRNAVPIFEWPAILRSHSFNVRYFSHRMASRDTAVDFRSHAPSHLATDDFVITEVTEAELLSVFGITAIFMVSV